MLSVNFGGACTNDKVDKSCPIEYRTHRMVSGIWRCNEHGLPPTKRGVTLFVMRDSKVLAVSRRHDHSDFGLPGGKVDDTDQNDMSALKREVMEEMGVDIYNLIPLLTYQVVFPNGDISRTATTFTAEVNGEPSSQPNEGIVKWVEPEVLLKGTFSDYNRNLLEFLSIPVGYPFNYWSRI